jgi:hypothetical protein
MTNKNDFTEQEWDLLREAPTSAALIVVTAAHGGSFRETFAIGKAYADARQQHGESELLDAIVGARPEVDHARYHSPEELKQHGLEHLRDAAELLERKATADELADYRKFVLGLAERVAEAHREDGVAVSDAERQALGEIASSLGAAEPATSD